MNLLTLTGDVTETERRTCEIYDDVCSNPAEYDLGDVLACERCAKVITEPEHPDKAEEARELRASEKLVDTEPNQEGHNE